MDKKQQNYASISFTAHYTGEMWQKLGLSHSALATKRGQQLHTLLKPVEWFANTFFGVSTNKTLQTRHFLMDDVATAFIEDHKDVQIIEIAAGLSPRGWRFLQKFPSISYTEVDLPEMSALKVLKSKDLPEPKPNFKACDVIQQDLTFIFEQLDKEKPVLIITEGLINYFSLDVLAILSKKLAHQMQAFKHSKWITENYPLSTNKNYNRLVNTASATLGKLTKSNFCFYFYKPQELRSYFNECGFDTVNVYQPSNSKVINNTKHLGDTVWVVELQP